MQDQVDSISGATRAPLCRSYAKMLGEMAAIPDESIDYLALLGAVYLKVLEQAPPVAVPVTNEPVEPGPTIVQFGLIELWQLPVCLSG
ncbi:MAG TPA: hypothetical protein VGN12_20055 [Pirellulales bacterium]|jgi:hypothetical protein